MRRNLLVCFFCKRELDCMETSNQHSAFTSAEQVEKCDCYTHTNHVTPSTCSSLPDCAPVTTTVPPTNAACPKIPTHTRKAPCPSFCEPVYTTKTACYTATSTLYPPCPAPTGSCTTADCIVATTVTVPPCRGNCKSTKTVTTLYACETSCPPPTCSTTTITVSQTKGT